MRAQFVSGFRSLLVLVLGLAGCGESNKPADVPTGGSAGAGGGGQAAGSTSTASGAGGAATSAAAGSGGSSPSSGGGSGGEAGAGGGAGGGIAGSGGSGGSAAVLGSLAFTRKDLHLLNYAEGIGIGDFNKDGAPDVHAGPYLWLGPDFETRHQLFPPPPNNAYDGMSLADWANYEYDVDGDGWLDSINVMRPSTPSYWYKNPGFPLADTTASWVKTELGTLVLEQSMFADLAGDGKPSIVGAADGQFGYFDPTPSGPWRFNAVGQSGATIAYAWWHGVGVGDLDGDAKLDLLTDSGWYTRPASGPRTGPWTKHPQRFKGEGVSDEHGPSHMYGYDVDGDGDQDVITALDSHAYGVAWYENDAGTFSPHVIVGAAGSMATNAGMIAPFSQPHALVVADVDGDGLKDLVTGKTFYAHPPGGGDPEADGTPVFYVFKLVRGAGGVSWEPHLVDSVVGLGRQFTTGDLNGDGKVDIAVASKHGAFLFFQQ
jgi:hypothetical protein